MLDSAYVHLCLGLHRLCPYVSIHVYGCREDREVRESEKRTRERTNTIASQESDNQGPNP